MKLNQRTLLQRILTGSVLVAVILAALWWGFLAFAVLFGLLAQVGLFEFYRMAVPRERRANIWPPYWPGAFCIRAWP